MNCFYRVKFKGNETKIDSEVLLDDWVARTMSGDSNYRKKLYEKYIKGKNFLFDASDEQVDAIAKLEKLQELLEYRSDKSVHISDSKADLEYDPDIDDYKVTPLRFIQYSKLLSVSKFLTTAGNRRDISKAIVTGTDESKYQEIFKNRVETEMEAKQKNEFFKTHTGTLDQLNSEWRAKVEARKTELWNKYKAKQDASINIGNDVHALMEYHARKRNGEDVHLKPGSILTKTDQQSALKITEDIFNEIVNRYRFSKNAKFYPEYEVFSDHIDGPTKKVLKEKLGIEYDGIVGRIDLLVVDNGKAYIFDFKTSDKYVDDWAELENEAINDGEWSSAKKLDAMKQVALYGAILNTFGIEFGGGEVIPIKVNYKSLDSDGYPSDIRTKRIEKDGRKITIANSDGDHTNIESLALDRSTEKWDAVKNSRNRSSAGAILRKYFPEMKSTISEIPPLNLKNLEDNQEDMKFIYGSREGFDSKEFQVTVNFYLGLDENGNKVRDSRIVELASDDKKRLQGFTHKMYISPKVVLEREDWVDSDRNVIFFKSDSGDEVIEKLTKYCNAMNNVLAKQYNDFAANVRNIYQIQGEDESVINETFQDFLGKSDPSKIEYLKNMLRKYLYGGWQLYGASDPENTYIQNGIFIFHNNQAIEIIVLTHDPLHYTVNFGTKRRPLTSITNGITNEREDNINILPSQKGNFHLIKALDIISRDPNILRNGELKIQNIQVVNPWHKTASWADNDTLYQNWLRLCSLSGGKLKAIPLTSFVNPVDAALNTAKEILYVTSVWNHISSKFDNMLSTETEIIKLIKIIKSKYKNAFNEDGTANLNDEVGYAVSCLYDALRLRRYLKTPLEHDRGAILQGGFLPIGLFIQNAGSSNVASVRTLDKLSGEFRHAWTNINNRLIDDVQAKLKIIYDELHYNPNTTSRKDFWKQFFIKENNRLSRSMKIKNFSDSFWDDKPKSKLAFKYILDLLAQYKGLKQSDTVSYEEYDTNKYYEIPLTKGSFIDACKENAIDDGLKGIANVVKKKVKDFIHTTESFYFGDENLYMDQNDDESDLTVALTNKYCVYTDDQRAKWCQNKETVYSTDIEAILGVTIAAQAISEASETYGYLYAAMKTAISANELFGGEKLQELKTFVEKYINAIYKGRNIMDPSLQFANKVLSEIKQITSKMTLGFNTRTFSREMLVSLYNGFLRSGQAQIGNITSDDFAFGLLYVFKHAPANLDRKQVVGQLNRKFGLVGQSRNEIVKANYISNFGLKTVDMDELAYLGTTIPDNYFRVAIAIAQLHSEGCFEAYVLDDKGELQYDPKKDSRFAKYLNNSPEPTFKDWDASMGPIAQYLNAKAKWNSALEEWRRIYPDQTITSLPEALTPSQIRSVQEECGRIYGYFDDDQKSLMTYQFIGAAIMQYKTWLSAKIDQWLKNPGFTNIWKQVHKKDINGKYLYILTHTTEEIENGLPPIEFITEDEITEEMVKNGLVLPYIVQEGTFYEGMVQSTINFASVLLSMGPKEFYKMWKEDPVARGNFICGTIDMWGMMLFAGLINLIFGEDVKNNKSSQPWFTQWSYGVLMGMAEDGPIHQVLGSMVGDWNPPSLLTLQRLAQTTQSVLTGTKTLPEGLVQSFGATREFVGFFKQ